MPGVGNDPAVHVIDFAQAEPSALVRCEDQLHLGEVTICRCVFGPNPGRLIAVSQLVISVHYGDRFILSWRNGAKEESQEIVAGKIHLSPPGVPIYLKWNDATPRVKVLAIDAALVHRILIDAGISSAATVAPAFGIDDNVIRQLAAACESEVTTQGASGRLYAEGLAMAMVTHVYRTYGGRTVEVSKGGLSPRAEKSVIDYIEQHLQDDIGLEDLAALAGLSAHYFIEAFRQSLGVPPYRYVLKQRVERAKALLLNSNTPTATIATTVGFSSQAQLTVNFRRFVGTTPGRFRRESGT